jgi:hypothetical protein
MKFIAELKYQYNRIKFAITDKIYFAEKLGHAHLHDKGEKITIKELVKGEGLQKLAAAQVAIDYQAKKMLRCSTLAFHNFQADNMLNARCIWCGKTYEEILKAEQDKHDKN